MQTFQRGFFCSDLTLRYPYRECTISVPVLLICMLLLPMLFICLVEFMRNAKRLRARDYMLNVCNRLANFSFGFIATYLSTELAKQVTGRLRPHFYAACQPRLLDGSTCEQLLPVPEQLSELKNTTNTLKTDIYVELYNCTNRNLSTWQLAELHVSFPSAHASLSFFAMVFLAFYIHDVWRGRGMLRLLRNTMQFTVIMIAWYISLSRITDYWHHWSDVLVGALLGMVTATLTAVYIGEFVGKRDLEPKSLIITARQMETKTRPLMSNHSKVYMKRVDTV